MRGKSSRDLFPYSFRERQEGALEFLQSHFPEKNICLDAATGFGKTPIILSALLVGERPVLWTVRTGNETDRPAEELKAINDVADENFFGFSYRGSGTCASWRRTGASTVTGEFPLSATGRRRTASTTRG